MKLGPSTTLYTGDELPTSVAFAVQALQQDLQQIFGQPLARAEAIQPNQIRLNIADLAQEEGFQLETDADENILNITGADELGLIFGIYSFCEQGLAVDPLQFWTEQRPEPQSEIQLPSFAYRSPAPKIRYRGWFINDEDCLIGWHEEMKISLKTWEKIFETLLRLGFNMIIPGTGSKQQDPQLQLAADMGIWLSQHHAEPLGAPLFHDVYPDVPAQVPEELERFETLYRKAILAQQKRPKTIWSLGFRGQGDLPFYVNDPRYASLEARGKLIGDMIQLQKRLIEELHEGPKVYVHNIYSESTELYREGHLSLDEEIIRVWADNGFGEMKARRERGEDTQISSLPPSRDRYRESGVYYHLSFHDLLLSSKLTPIVSPELIQDQFQKLFASGNMEYLLVNVSNIRPHLFHIDFLRKLCVFPEESLPTDTDPVAAHYASWTQRYFPGHEQDVSGLLQGYHRAFASFQDNPHNLIGEQICHHGLRNAITLVLAGKEDPRWAFPYMPEEVHSLREAFAWIRNHVAPTLPLWQKLNAESQALREELQGHAHTFYTNSVWMQIGYLRCSFHGLLKGLDGLEAYLAADYQEAFCRISESAWLIAEAQAILEESSQGHWEQFHRGDWLTGTRETLRRLRTAQGYCKIKADAELIGPWSTWSPQLIHDAGISHIHPMIQATPDYDQLARYLMDEPTRSLKDLLR